MTSIPNPARVDDFDDLYEFYRNVYYQPETWLLEIVDQIEDGGGYEFDKAVLFKHRDGTFWLSEDAGCSCPTPFEPVREWADMTHITSSRQILDRLRGRNAGDVIDMIRKAEAVGLPAR